VCCDTDVDECAVNNGGCSPLANCTNTPGHYTCTCIEGYTGDGVNCSGKARRKTLPSLSVLCNRLPKDPRVLRVGTLLHTILRYICTKFIAIWQLNKLTN